MPIISTKEGTNINSEHVVQFTRLRNGQTRFLLSTGGEVTADAHRDDINELFIPVLPAQPGFVAVFAERWPDGVFQYNLRTVIAWQLCPSGTYPLFEGYRRDDDDFAAMIDPAGGIFDSDHNRYDSFDAWRTAFEAEANAADEKSPWQAAAA